MRAPIRLITWILISVLPNFVAAQLTSLSMRIVDSETLQPIEAAHVFFDNTTMGSVSDSDGLVRIVVPPGFREDLIISHISYKLTVIPYRVYFNLPPSTEIKLESNALALPELVVIARHDRKWKKQFKKFSKAFLGEGEAADNCIIRNPDVLRFEESEDLFRAFSTEPLEIENKYLGYTVHYHLTYLTIRKDGSVEYLGRARFEEAVSGRDPKAIDAIRLSTYKHSPKYFFKSLIENKLDENGFVVQMMEYEAGQFKFLKPFERDSSLRKSAAGDKYSLEFDAFLQVYNTNSLNITYSQTGVRSTSLEAQRFSGSIREEKPVEHYLVSWIYKVSPYIILNAHGNVLNSKDIKEYGYWASQKVALQLPFDYGNAYRETIDKTTPGNKQAESKAEARDKLEWFLALIYESGRDMRKQAFEKIKNNWEAGFAPCLVEVLRLSRDEETNENINNILRDKFDIEESKSYYDWLPWMWKQDLPNPDYYFNLKAEFYKLIDPAFEKYFKDRQDETIIDLDEVVWGGVRQDGIPPLRHPDMIPAQDAHYLQDSDIVFGLFINGVARAYPKRILAWHEFFTDDFGDTPVAGVYCTLCGTVIAYEMESGGTFHDVGTSGFLYRSNKLMYDRETQSLWSTIDGEPVIGPLTGQGIKLQVHPVVTTTWGNWRAMHPDTRVLSIETGYDRDYAEGAAYKDYFATDALMFPVPFRDTRLRNKDEVFVARVPGYTEDPLAITVEYLKEKKWHQDKIDDTHIVFVADKSGAIRAYETGNTRFVKYKNGALIDSDGIAWTMKETHLKSPDGRELIRLPGHNIFWFAWVNAYPGTRLVSQ